MGCGCSKAVGGPAPPSALYCRLPEGVHSHMLEHVDLKKLTKLIKQGRLAPLYPHDVAQLDPAEVSPAQVGALQQMDGTQLHRVLLSALTAVQIGKTSVVLRYIDT